MAGILDSINNPQDLKKLDQAELKVLCDEIRGLLLDTVKNNGGHLASNLGAVELTIALHRVFNSPDDKIIWDAGHQSYVHKLLTGRRERFSSLRQYGGISGFPDPAESDHDPFGTGHTSTSISAGLGMAVARDLAGEDYDVIAVIGDGALTGGMAYEAMNHAGHLHNKLIVVLIDNGMSISPTVGAVSRRLNTIRMDHRVRKAKTEAKRLLSRTRLGRIMNWAYDRMTLGAKAVVMPKLIWEELGFTYIGPVDGHNISDIEIALKQAQMNDSEPSFVHVVTTKGKGYKEAEESPSSFHSVAPAGHTKKAITYSEVFSQTTLRLAKEDPRIAVITAAMLDGNCLEPVAAEFPQRFFDVGICEEHAITMAAGLARQGYKPIVAIYSTFLQRGFDQILHDVCLQDLPVIFAVDRAGIVGDDGRTHQGIFDLSYLTLMPNMVVAAPGDENELQHLLFSAIHSSHPYAIRYPRGAGTGTPLDEKLAIIPEGKGKLLRTGNDVTLIAIGSTVAAALEAAGELAKMGIEASVVNAQFAKPLDSDLILEEASRTGKMMTIEENNLCGGFGSSVLSLIHSSNIGPVTIRCIGIPNEFVEHGPQAVLRARYHLDAGGIVTQVLSGFPALAKTAASTHHSNT